jgi:hypothetical protein
VGPVIGISASKPVIRNVRHNKRGLLRCPPARGYPASNPTLIDGVECDWHENHRAYLAWKRPERSCVAVHPRAGTRLPTELTAMVPLLEPSRTQRIGSRVPACGWAAKQAPPHVTFNMRQALANRKPSTFKRYDCEEARGRVKTRRGLRVLSELRDRRPE